MSAFLPVATEGPPRGVAPNQNRDFARKWQIEIENANRSAAGSVERRGQRDHEAASEAGLATQKRSQFPAGTDEIIGASVLELGAAVSSGQTISLIRAQPARSNSIHRGRLVA